MLNYVYLESLYNAHYVCYVDLIVAAVSAEVFDRLQVSTRLASYLNALIIS